MRLYNTNTKPNSLINYHGRIFFDDKKARKYKQKRWLVFGKEKSDFKHDIISKKLKKKLHRDFEKKSF